MSDMSPSQLTALTNLLSNLCPSLSLSLAEQINRDVTLEPLHVQAVPIQEILSRAENVLYTFFALSAPLSAESVFLFPRECASLFADLMSGNDGSEPPLNPSNAQVEQLTQMAAGFARGFATALTLATGDTLEVESSTTALGNINLPPIFALESVAIEAQIALTIPELIETEMTFLFTPDEVRKLVPEAEAASESRNDVIGDDELAAMLSELGSLGGGGGEGSALPGMPPMSSTPSPFASFATESESSLPRGMELILDIPLDVTVELGRVRMLIKDVLELASGSIVELDRVAGEPVDLLVNGRLIAKGEVVVIEDNFGIRITEIISPAERVAGLGKGR
jgi:flagellar motor switch protein FliN/FliY